MTLLAQLDTTAIPPGIVRGHGLVQVFYCGPGADDPSCDAALQGWEAFAPAHVQRLVPHSTEGRTSNLGAPLPSHHVAGWLPVRDVPDYFELRALGVRVGEPPDEVEAFPYPGDKLGGWPRWVQGIEYPTCPDCGTNMALVLQIESERTLPIMFGDIGTGYLTQCLHHPTVLGFGWACS